MNDFIPNSFQTPNVLIDQIMPLLTPQEWVVLSFATRQILGWRDKINERQAAISLTRFGETGLSRPAIIAALKSLEQYKLLHKQGDPTPDGQVWKLIYDENVDIQGLQDRQKTKRNRGQKRSEKARSVRLTSNRSVPLTGGGQSDLHNKDQDQTQGKDQEEIHLSKTDPLGEELDAPIQSVLIRKAKEEKAIETLKSQEELPTLQSDSVTHETTVITEPLQSSAKVSPFSLIYTANASELLEPRKMAAEPKPKADPVDKPLKDAIAQHIQGIKPDEAVALTGILAQKAAGVWRRRLKVDKLNAEQYQAVARSLPVFVQWYRSSDGCGPDCSLPSGNPNKFEQWYAKFPTDWKPGGMSTTVNGEPMWVQDPEGPGMITPAQRRAKLARMEAERVGSQTS